MKTIGKMAGRMKFTENEIAMVQGLALATYEINLDLAKKEGIELYKESNEKSKESIFKLVTKSFWNIKKKTYPTKEFPEDYFAEYAEIFLNEIFVVNKGDETVEKSTDS